MKASWRSASVHQYYNRRTSVSRAAVSMASSSSHSKITRDFLPSAAVWQLWQAVRTAKPLTQCITNYVSMEFMAATLLAAGASPAMVHSVDEVEAFVDISSALLINMGTLSSEWVASKKLAAKQARNRGKPWVLDPVGCGATPYRTRACQELLLYQPTVIRGNASEVMALSGAQGKDENMGAEMLTDLEAQGSVKGVDSTACSNDAVSLAVRLARDKGCVVAVSGAIDYVTDGTRVLQVHNGVEMLTAVTAAGCSLTALVAAFVSQLPQDPVFATASAMAIFGLASEEALASAAIKGPGSLRVDLIDKLYLMDETTVMKGIRINEGKFDV